MLRTDYLRKPHRYLDKQNFLEGVVLTAVFEIFCRLEKC